MPHGITKLSWFMETLAEIAAAALAILVIWGVIRTYVFKASDILSVEVSEYLLVFICFASVAWVLRENRHVKMEVIISTLASRARLLTNAVTSILALGFCSVVVWKATEVMLYNYHRDFKSASLVGFPLWIPYFVIAIGILILSLQYLVRISEFVGGLRGSIKSRGTEKAK